MNGNTKRNQNIADDEPTYTLQGISGVKMRFVITHTTLGIRSNTEKMIAAYLFFDVAGIWILSGNAGAEFSLSMMFGLITGVSQSGHFLMLLLIMSALSLSFLLTLF